MISQKPTTNTHAYTHTPGIHTSGVPTQVEPLVVQADATISTGYIIAITAGGIVLLILVCW